MKRKKMIHPGKDWKKSPREIRRDVRFLDILKEQKANNRMYELCLKWEFQRTLYLVDKNIKAHVDHSRKLRGAFLKRRGKAKTRALKRKVTEEWNERKQTEGINYEGFFPQFIESWPNKPFLSHPIHLREKWTSKDYYPYFESPDNPLVSKLIKPSPHEPETMEWQDIRLTGAKLGLSGSIPLELHINPNWSKKKFQEVMETFSKDIMAKAVEEQRLLEKQGVIVKEKETPRPLSHLKTSLKVLGHYRLHKFLNLEWHEVLENYGKDGYGNRDGYQTAKIFGEAMEDNGILSDFSVKTKQSSAIFKVLGYD